MVAYAPAAVRVYGDFAAQAGTYTFAWQGAAGNTVEMRSRFSLTFRRDHPTSTRAWTIVEHHSSSMPSSPLELELSQVRTGRATRVGGGASAKGPPICPLLCGASSLA